MSGRNKRILYTVTTVVLLLASIASIILMWYFSGVTGYLLLGVAAVYVLLPIHIIVHEMGHLAFGGAQGMKFVSVQVGNFRLSRNNGKLYLSFEPPEGVLGVTAFYPAHARNMRRRMILTALGGAVCNLIYFIIFFTLYFISRHPALLFFELFAPSSLVEAVSALLPVDLSAGKTDGRVALGLLRRDAEEEVMLRVLTAEGLLKDGSFAEIPLGLFRVPVVREDLAALASLKFIEMQTYLFRGDTERAHEIYGKLRELEEPSEELREELERYSVCFGGGEFVKKPSPLAGVNALEETLSAPQK